MYKIFTYCCVLLLFCGVILQAQDAHFSQNFATPLYANPAMSGLYDGDVRVSAVYRNQWASLSNSSVGARTVLLSAEAKLTPGPTKGGWLSGGINLYNDKTGGVGIITNSLDFSLAYNTPIDGKQFISVGTTVGMSGRKLDLSDAQFGNQYGEVGFDENINSNETFDNESFSSFNLSGGLVYYYVKSPRSYYFGGLALYNITGPRYSFQDFTDTRLPMRISAQAGAAVNINSNLDVVPSVYFMKQGKSVKTDIGSYVRFVFSQNKQQRTFRAFNIGPFVRVAGSTESSVSFDALVFAAKVDYDDISIGMSYDFNISKLNNATNGRGGPELAVVYTPKIRENKFSAPVSCPRF